MSLTQNKEKNTGDSWIVSDLKATNGNLGRFNQMGFTLIELSIVLIIIGLIVGGVLVGQDLIRAAEIRATVSQIEKYNTEVNTFRTKFGSMPGDMTYANASAFGLSGDSANGWGNGNGLIDGPGGSLAWTQEAGWFWVQLSQASLLDGSFSVNWSGASPIAVTGSASVTNTFPPARLGRGNYVNVGSAAGINYWMVSGITAATAAGNITSTVAMTPIEVYNMDSKLDDGNPLTGLVQTHATTGSSNTAFTDPPSANTASTIGDCVVGDTAGTATSDTYNRNLSTGGNSMSCEARFRFN